MAEFRKGSDDFAGGRLPWLEPVEDEELPDDGAGIGRAILVGLLVLAVIAGGIAITVWARRLRAQHADIGTIIRAPTTPYKVRPSDPGGMDIASTGAVAERTGIGGDINGVLDPGALPEQPMTRAAPNAPLATAPITPPTPAPAKAPPSTTAPVPTHATPLVIARPVPRPAPEPRPAAPAASGGGAIQLGALPSEDKAKAAWKSLSKRFDFLGEMTMSITPVTVGDRTFYRLRASGGGGAAGLCARLRLAGESCLVVAPGA